MSDSNKPSLGLAVFLLIAGVALFAERFGWISADFKWGLPAILIAFGISMLFSYLRK